MEHKRRKTRSEFRHVEGNKHLLPATNVSERYKLLRVDKETCFVDFQHKKAKLFTNRQENDEIFLRQRIYEQRSENWTMESH